MQRASANYTLHEGLKTKTTIKNISKKILNIIFFANTINKGNKKIVIDIKFKEYVPIIDNICKEFK